MEVLLFIYNLFLNILYFLPVVLSVVIYNTTHFKGYLYIASLYGFFLLDEIVIFLTEFIDWFAEIYRNILFVAPTFKTIIYLITFYCGIKIVEWVFSIDSQKFLYVLLGFLAVFLFFVPVMRDTSFKLWIYYTAASAYGIVFSFVSLSKYKHISARERTSVQVLLRISLTIVLVMFVSIMLEDTITLFNPNSILYRNARSISEDVMRIILSFITISCLNRNIFVETEGDNEVVEIVETVPDAYSKFYLFCKQYGLTTREQDILALLLEDMSNEQISKELIIALGTAKTHIHNIYAKVDVNKRKGLIEKYEIYVSSAEK